MAATIMTELIEKRRGEPGMSVLFLRLNVGVSNVGAIYPPSELASMT